MTVALKSGQWFWDSQTSGPGAIHRDGTFMVIGNIDSAGADQQATLEGLQPGDVMHLDHVDDPDGWWAYTVTEAPAPGGALPPVAATHLLVDNYSGGFIRVRPAPDAATTVDFALATVPGPGGAVYADIGAIAGGSAVWADFAGNLGHLKMADGTDVLGSTLKEWIRRGAVYNVTKDATDPAHPNLIVGAEVPPPPPADVTRVKVTSGGHGPTANPAEGSAMVVSFMLMAGPTAPPVTPPSLAAQAVADYLGVPTPDQRMEVCALAAQAWVEKRRSKTDRSELWLDSSVVLGAVMYAALLYQQRAQPQGFPGMDALGTFSEDTGAAMSQIFRLVGADVVIA
jgi:hypothetical protein